MLIQHRQTLFSSAFAVSGLRTPQAVPRCEVRKPQSGRVADPAHREQDSGRWQNAIAPILLLLGFATASGAAEAKLSLVKDGQPQAAIVLAAEPGTAAQFAAFELQEHIFRITGARLPITNDAAAPLPGVQLLVGASKATASLGLPDKPFVPQESLVAFRPGVIALLGKDSERKTKVKYDANDPFAFESWPDFYEDHATTYAVYDFLERQCDVRWFRPGDLGLSCPQTKTLEVTSAPDLRRTPAFLYRQPSWLTGNSEGWEMAIGLWDHKTDSDKLLALDRLAYPELLRWNGPGWNYTHAKRGVVRLFMHRMRVGGEPYGANHSFYGFYNRYWEKSADPNAAKLFVEKQPDWFAKGYEGQPPQMCYTNKKFIRQVVQDARDYYDGKGKLPGAVAAGDYFGLVPMDNVSYCKCSTCQKWFNREDAENRQFSNGKWSDYVYEFVNQVARELRKSHPDKILSTLAYADNAYPPHKIKLEPNVSVGFCLHVRNLWCKSLQDNDWKLVKDWMENDPGRRYFLFLYYCFPVENAQNSGFHCFPGFFAHGIDYAFKLYAKYKVRGVDFCGFGQDVEAYVSFKLLDDPSLNVDRLLDDYFTRQYGPAAVPMKALYLEIEKIYSSPEYYPPGFNSHQVEKVAWENLGAEPRLARLGELMQQARDAAVASPEKERVAYFDGAVWEYMTSGRKLHWAREWHRENPVSPTLRIPQLPEPAAAPDFAKAAVIGKWLTETGESAPAATKITASFWHDGRNLYLQLQDAGHGKGGAWDLVLCRSRQLPLYRLTIEAVGTTRVTVNGTGAAAWQPQFKLVKADVTDERQCLTAAIPLADLLPGGMEPGWHCFGNIVYRPANGEPLVWSPNVAGSERPEWCNVIQLELDPAAKPAPAAAPAQPVKSQPRELAPGVTVEAMDVLHLNMATDDALQGKPFEISPKGVYWFWNGQTNPPKCPVLTDAVTPRTPVADLFAEGAPEIFYTWELGAPPPEGRRLKQARLWWSLDDGMRNGIKVRFAIRRNGKDWEEVTPVLEEKQSPSQDNQYKVLNVDFTGRNLSGFDAFRLIDCRGSYNPRLIELDVQTEAGTR